MAQERLVTPEKQLLRLIEDPNSKNASAKTGATKYRGLRFLSFSAWRCRVLFSTDILKKWFSYDSLRKISIRQINYVLAVGLVILGLYFMYSISFSVINLRNVRKPQFTLSGSTVSHAEVKEVAGFQKPLSDYLEQIRKRDIFAMGKKETADTTTPVSSFAASDDATDNLRLVGISWSNDPDAMIEDTRALRTFFVKRGQMIGDVKVEAIFKDKVILRHGGKEAVLR